MQAHFCCLFHFEALYIFALHFLCTVVIFVLYLNDKSQFQFAWYHVLTIRMFGVFIYGKEEKAT